MKTRIQVAEDFDLEAFRNVLAEDTGVKPDEEVARIALHKARCELMYAGRIDRKLGEESAQWLAERGMRACL